MVGAPYQDDRCTQNDEPQDDELVVYNQHGLEIHERPNGKIDVRAPKFIASVIDARELRDALNEYLGDGGNHESAAFPKDQIAPDDVVTVEVDADVSAAREAIESLQADVDALTDNLNDAAEHVEEWDFTASDFGLPAPSPSDVQGRLDGDTDSHTTDVEMVPAEPLYELAEMWAAVSVHDPMGDKRAGGYRQARKESGEWLKEELDELTEGDDSNEVVSNGGPQTDEGSS